MTSHRCTRSLCHLGDQGEKFGWVTDCIQGLEGWEKLKIIQALLARSEVVVVCEGKVCLLCQR